MLLAFLIAAAAATPPPQTITNALRLHLTAQMPHEIRTLECPESEEATKASFECKGEMIDGQRFTVKLERQSNGLIEPKTIMFEGPEYAVRELIKPWLPGDLGDFDCPDAPAPGPFTCRGTTSDGSAFTVAVERKPEMNEVQSITYDATRKSAFVAAIAAYAGGDAALSSINCPVSGEGPASFECEARFRTGPLKTIRVARQPSGQLVPTAIVVPHSPSKLVRGIGIALLLLGIAAIIIAIVRILGIGEKLIVARLPLVAEQTIHFDSPAAYVLQIEGPHFTTAFAGLHYVMIENATGLEVTTFPILMRSTTSGFSKVRMSIRRFFVQNAGDHTLRVAGIREDRLRPGMALVFSRPWPVAGYVWTAVAVAAGLMLMLGLFALLAA